MAQTKRLIFQVNDLEKTYGTYLALKIGKLEIHPGTIYGIIGTVGSGKSTLLTFLLVLKNNQAGLFFMMTSPIKRTGAERSYPMRKYFIPITQI